MSLSVLICDDSNMARKQVLRSLPEALSDQVQLATQGEEALAILRSQHIDVLFLDLTMPILDGVGVLTAIKNENIAVNVFVISADIQANMQTRVLDLGAKAFLRKPVKAELLLETLHLHHII